MGIILIVIGVIWILINLNIIDINLYSIVKHIIRGVFDLWPLILVIVGVNIIFKKEMLNTLLWILFVVVLIVYSLFIKDGISKRPSNIVNNSPDKILNEQEYTTEMRSDIEKGKLDLDIGATNFNVDFTDDHFIDLNHDGSFNYKMSNKSGIENFYISNENSFLKNNNTTRKFELALNKNIPWDFDMDIGAASGYLNLEEVMVGKMDLDMGAGKVEVFFGDKGDSTFIDIDAGASKITLNIPKDSGLKINEDGALNSTNFDELSLIKLERGKYVSDNFNTASTKFEIDLDMGVGSFDINYY